MINFVNAHEFETIVKNLKQIICFGAGKNSKNLGSVFKNTEVLDKITFFVDNNELLWGKENVIDDRRYKIIPIEQLRKINLEKTIILVTCIEYEEIMEQIGKSY